MVLMREPQHAYKGRFGQYIFKSPAALEETHRDGSLERTSAFIQRTVRTIEETL